MVYGVQRNNVLHLLWNAPSSLLESNDLRPGAGFLKTAPANIQCVGKKNRSRGGEGSDGGVWESLKLVRGQGAA